MGTVFKGSLDLNSMCVEDAAPVCVVCICIESKLGGKLGFVIRDCRD